jgi:hypothetical protein
VLQVLFSEHGKLNRLAELSGGASSFGAPSPAFDLPGARCPSKREVLAQHHELRRLREDFARLQVRPSPPPLAAVHRFDSKLFEVFVLVFVATCRSSAARCRLRWTG